jgi:hypothetical protein
VLSTCGQIAGLGDRPEQNSIEDRTDASEMRDSGVPEEIIARLYGSRYCSSNRGK